MFLRLFLLFTVIPVIELAILIRVGTAIGVLNTIAVVLVTGAAGAYLARSQGFGILAQIRLRMDQGSFPASELIDGVLVLAAGIVLITPGLVTDIAGFLLLIPPTRRIAKKYLTNWIQRRIQDGTIEHNGSFPHH